jgi:hypothetical protein
MKSQNKYLYNLLLGIFIVSVFVVCQAAQPKSQKPADSQQKAAVAEKTDTIKADTGKAPITKGRKIVVYYFHGNMRCHTCYNLENLAKSEVESDFASAIKKGKLEWQTINVETAGNEHFSNDYKLYTKSVIVSTIVDGKEVSWKNLDQIWQLVHNKTEYREYIKREVEACFKGKCL